MAFLKSEIPDLALYQVWLLTIFPHAELLKSQKVLGLSLYVKKRNILLAAIVVTVC